MSVNAILEERYDKQGNLEYLIEWKAKMKDDSWEYAEDLEESRGFATALKKYKGEQSPEAGAAATPKKGRKSSADTPASTKKRRKVSTRSPAPSPSPASRRSSRIASRSSSPVSASSRSTAKQTTTARKRNSMTASQFISNTSPFAKTSSKYSADQDALDQARHRENQARYHVEERFLPESEIDILEKSRAVKRRFAVGVIFACISCLLLLRASIDSPSFGPP